MSKIPFSFAVVRYVHDRGAGETLNVGVVLFAKDASYLDAQVDIHFERLSSTFRGFSGEHYRRVRGEFLQGVSELAKDIGSMRLLQSDDRDVADVIRRVWPDRDLSFSLGSTKSGLTSDPERELNLLYERMVLSQIAVRLSTEHRTDEDVWRSFQPSLSGSVRSALKPTTIVTADVTVEFERSFKNERWHAVQPLSFDYKRDDTIQRRATEWVGLATGLEQAKELGRVYFLLGAPSDSGQKKAYERAKNLLHKMHLKHEIVEEDDAASFALELEQEMKRHGVI
jgi:hypothetical protein